MGAAAVQGVNTKYFEHTAYFFALCTQKNHRLYVEDGHSYKFMHLHFKNFELSILIILSLFYSKTT